MELGLLKCLLILGVPVSRLAHTGFALGHQDVDVLGMEVLSRSTSEVIEQALSQVSQRMRPPVQIVSDQGSDLKKGISLYQHKHPAVVWTDDVTHQMALLLEKELADDEGYQSFVQRTLTRYLCFDSWDHLLNFMLAQLELDIPPAPT